MEEDLLAPMEALTTQERDTDPAGAPPAVQTALEDATLAASSGENVGQESMGPRESDEMEKLSDLSLCLNVEGEAPCPQAAPNHAAQQEANSRGNVGKKSSRKGRNRKERKIVYFPWPLTLRTRASSAAAVLGNVCVTWPLPSESREVSVEHAAREQRRNSEMEETSVLTQPWEAPAGAPLPAASPAQPSPEGDSLVAKGETKVGKKNSRKRRNKYKKKIMASPWPLTVRVWAPYPDPGQLPTAPAAASEVADDGVDVGLRSGGPMDEKDTTSVVTSCHSAQGQGSLKEVSFANDGGDVGKKSRCKTRNEKNKSVLSSPWPLTVQAWASFTNTGLVQTHWQGKSSKASIGMSMGQESWLQLEKSKEEAKSGFPWEGASFPATPPGQASFEGAPALEDLHSKLSQTRKMPKREDEDQVQGSAEKSLEPSQGCKDVERYSGDQDFWEYTEMNVAGQADCRDRGELCPQEKTEALTLTRADTHVCSSVVGTQGQERESAESETGWMEKREDV
ncbi:hypothetical protein E2I00_012348 [Balaenoptera physalus]|uniref:Uncharacterized protein n=1 Tax=Balaenoptera physalus TaxID=9770 RepID=A0A6A1QI88_BALPH|nr:hypothetical protein E2I00_012348 [Balaenoptera physalus]